MSKSRSSHECRDLEVSFCSSVDASRAATTSWAREAFRNMGDSQASYKSAMKCGTCLEMVEQPPNRPTKDQTLGVGSWTTRFLPWSNDSMAPKLPESFRFKKLDRKHQVIFVLNKTPTKVTRQKKSKLWRFGRSCVLSKTHYGLFTYIWVVLG